MRFLKKKIFRAQEVATKSQAQSHSNSPNEVETEESPIKLKDQYQFKYERSISSQSDEIINSGQSPKRARLGSNSRHLSSTKNIAMNYGRAIASFASSSLAMPYLEPNLQEMNVTKDEFLKFLGARKRKIQGINGLRSLLVVEREDDAKTKACKKLFQWLAEVFIKCFSVNWIINGKVSHKMVYLKFRFKMLRRIQNPEHFTFIKERKKKT